MDEFPPPPPYTKFSLPSCERLIKGSEFYTGVRIPTTPILEPLTSGPAGYPSAPLPNNHHRKLFPIYTLMPTGAVDVLHFWENDPAPNCPGVALVEVYAGRRCVGAPDRPCVPSAHRPNKIQLLIEFPGYARQVVRIRIGPPEKRLSSHVLAFLITQKINEYFKNGEFDPKQARRHHPDFVAHHILNLRLVSLYAMRDGAVWGVQLCHMIPGPGPH